MSSHDRGYSWTRREIQDNRDLLAVAAVIIGAILSVIWVWPIP